MPAPAGAQRRGAGLGALEHVATGVADVEVASLARVARHHGGDLAHLAHVDLDAEHVAHMAGEPLAGHEVAHHAGGVRSDHDDIAARRQAGEQLGHARKGVQVGRDGQGAGRVVDDCPDDLARHAECRHAVVDVVIEQRHHLRRSGQA